MIGGILQSVGQVVASGAMVNEGVKDLSTIFNQYYYSTSKRCTFFMHKIKLERKLDETITRKKK